MECRVSIKDPLLLGYLQLQIISGSSSNNYCLIKNWKSLLPRGADHEEGNYMCPQAFISCSLPLCLWSACWGTEAVLCPGRWGERVDRTHTGETKCARVSGD